MKPDHADSVAEGELGGKRLTAWPAGSQASARELAEHMPETSFPAGCYAGALSTIVVASAVSHAVQPGQLTADMRPASRLPPCNGTYHARI